MKLQVRLRDQDEALRKYFESIKPGDQAYEARRLMELGLAAIHGGFGGRHETRDIIRKNEE
jgi:hypothetical protein